MPNIKPYGVLCQWHLSPIAVSITLLHFLTLEFAALIDDTLSTRSILGTYAPTITFSCAEQSYMICKALYFCDAASCARTINSPDPKEEKKLGQRVTNFSECHWNTVKDRVCRVGNWYKFTNAQNKHIRDVLLGTGEIDLAEASRRDRIWGIGYNEAEAEKYRKQWGTNLLGKALMAVRKRIRAVEGDFEDWDGDVEKDDERIIPKEVAHNDR